MLGHTFAIFPIDRSALAAHTSTNTDPGMRNNFQPTTFNGKLKIGRPWFDKCKKPNHALDTCWKIYGKSAYWKPAREKRANVVATENHSTDQQP